MQVVLLMFLMACGFGPAPETGPSDDRPGRGGNGGDRGNNGDLNFTDDIQPILENNCALSGCHPRAPLFDSADGFLNSNAARRIINGSMPPSYSPKYGQWAPTNKAVVLEWYDDNM